MLEIKNISFKKDNKLILDKINLNIEDNSLVVITGPNGSGKSSLAKVLIGINKPTSGKIIFNDKDITRLSINEKANLGFSYAFQTPINFKGLKVIDLFKAINKNTTFNNMKKYLSLVGLCAKDYINRDFDDSLSGGEKKRIEMALILYKSGKVNIFDEPEAGIDLWSFENLVKVFENKKNNITIIISHGEKILNIADKIILLDKGRIVNEGSKKEMNNLIKKNPCRFCGDKYEEVN